MAGLSAAELRSYLLLGQLRCRGRAHARRWSRQPELNAAGPRAVGHQLHTSGYNDSPASAAVSTPGQQQPRTPTTPTPLRKQLKDEAKALKAVGKHPKQKKKPSAQNQVVPGWELTVGIEIHAQLNADHKLFSAAAAPAPLNPHEAPASPNTQVKLFDLAVPGSQPVFQPATLLPALRAALALNCAIQPASRFDRKHYMHWDQPAGYQLTQYYAPLARAGHVDLHARDGIAAADGAHVRVGIRQVQLEQDTAKTLDAAAGAHWVDYNRAGVALVEIITEPTMRHPATAAALVRKVQQLLRAADACVGGMESGALRADVNVSVRRAGRAADDGAERPLGTRTEIKNLSSVRAVEDAVVAERDRQIAVLEAGGVVVGETRGWTLGSTETRRLRGKEGEVDYRYMPDPDLGPLLVGTDLVEHLRDTMGRSPDAEADALIAEHGLTPKDALSLMALDGGGRVEYFYKVLAELERRLDSELSDAENNSATDSSHSGKGHALLAANWCLHELGRLTAGRESSLYDNGSSATRGDGENDLGMAPDGTCRRVPADSLAELLFHLHRRRITAPVAKELLWALFRGAIPGGDGATDSVTAAIDRDGLWFRELTSAEYAALAEDVLDEVDGRVLAEFAGYYRAASATAGNEAGGVAVPPYPTGKLMFLVGRLMRAGPEGRMGPLTAERVLREVVERRVKEELLTEEDSA